MSETTTPEQDQLQSSADATGTKTAAKKPSAHADQFEADSWEPSLLARMRKAMTSKPCD